MFNNHNNVSFYQYLDQKLYQKSKKRIFILYGNKMYYKKMLGLQKSFNINTMISTLVFQNMVYEDIQNVYKYLENNFTSFLFIEYIDYIHPYMKNI